MERVRLDYTYIMRDLRAEGGLLTIEEIQQIQDKIEQLHGEIKNERIEKKELSFLSLPYAYTKGERSPMFGDVFWKAKDLIKQKARQIREKGTDYVQLAIGGSALGAITFYNALGDALDKRQTPNACKIHLPDNIDPEWIGKLLDSIRIEKSYFTVISKSGDTVETIANFFVFFDALKKKISAKKLREHFIVITDPENGTLARLCQQEGLTLIPIPSSVHGRFSVLSPGGLLTAAVAGINIDEVLAGARSMDKITEEKPFWKNPLHLCAAIHYLAHVQKGLDTLILMPYSYGLRTIADWYSQLIAESLGKNGKGVTPVKALGPTDQHSQLQLYNEGPKNKFLTFFCVDEYRKKIRIPKAFPKAEEFDYLRNHTLNELIHAEQKATAFSLYNQGVPNCEIRIPKISAFYLGQLFILLEKVVCLLGKLYDVNVFNQPAVEESKEYARAMMGKKEEDYENKREAMNQYSNPDKLKIC
jgi:glucose-6-phosphate isomerase